MKKQLLLFAVLIWFLNIISLFVQAQPVGAYLFYSGVLVLFIGVVLLFESEYTKKIALALLLSGGVAAVVIAGFLFVGGVAH